MSKDTLAIAIVTPTNALLHEQRIANKKLAIVAFFKQLPRVAPGFSPLAALSCLEHTGLHNRPLLEAVQGLALPTWVEHAPQITASTGLSRGKTDQADARRIAAYAARFVDPAPARAGRARPAQRPPGALGEGAKNAANPAHRQLRWSG